MRKPVTTGLLRQEAYEIIQAVRNGSIDPNRAHAIAKVLRALNENISAETKVQFAVAQAGGKPPEFGRMVIGETPEINGTFDLTDEALGKRVRELMGQANGADHADGVGPA